MASWIYGTKSKRLRKIACEASTTGFSGAMNRVLPLVSLLMANPARKIEVEISAEEFLAPTKDAPRRRYKKLKGTEFISGTSGRVTIPDPEAAP
jgi:hypothetical protein